MKGKNAELNILVHKDFFFIHKYKSFVNYTIAMHNLLPEIQFKETFPVNFELDNVSYFKRLNIITKYIN